MNPVEISSDEFRRLAERVTQIASEYLETIDVQVISPATSGGETLRLFRTPLPEDGIGETALNALPEVYASPEFRMAASLATYWVRESPSAPWPICSRAWSIKM